MKDRFKCRVWDKYEKSYWLQSTIEQNIHWLMNPEEYKDANYPPDCVKIEQCTGLKDNNGKPIYEGDIVKRSGQTFIVEWRQDRLSFVLSNYKILFESYDITHFDLEIIGNINENAYLLEK